jgi:hypothetical protein
VLFGPIQTAADGLRAEVRVDASTRAVFDYVSDLRNMETWWPEHPMYRRLRGDGGRGTLYAWIYMARGFPVAGVSRVLARDAAERFEYRAGPPGVGVRIGYRFAPDGSSTRIGFSFLTFLARAPGFATHLVPEVTRALDRLAALIPKAGAAVTTYDQAAYDERLPSRLPRYKQTLFKGEHAPIVAPEIWQKAQQIKATENTVKRQRSGPKANETFSLTG